MLQLQKRADRARTVPEIVSLVEGGNFIPAIKKIRDNWAFDLTNSKAVIDQLRLELDRRGRPGMASSTVQPQKLGATLPGSPADALAEILEFVDG